MEGKASFGVICNYADVSTLVEEEAQGGEAVGGGCGHVEEGVVAVDALVDGEDWRIHVRWPRGK